VVRSNGKIITKPRLLTACVKQI